MSERMVARAAPTPVQSAPTGLLQRCGCGGKEQGECESCKRKRLQRKASGSALRDRLVPSIVEAALAAPGRPLPEPVRGAMEARFLHDFSRVQIHDGPLAAASATAVSAQAYTVGRSIVFGAGEYAPQSARGHRLLAHELTHVLQQKGDTAVAGPPAFMDPAGEARHEAEADRMADQLGGPAAVSSTEPGLIQRQAAPAPAAGVQVKKNVAGTTGMGRYDAAFDPSTCKMTIQMRIKFHPHPGFKKGDQWQPETAPGPGLPKVSPEFEKWKADFISTVQGLWGAEATLNPKGACADLACGTIKTGLAVTETKGSDAHINAHVRKSAGYIRSFAGFGNAFLDSNDLTSETRPKPTVPYVEANHEFGHLLGLKHIKCDSNDDICYGKTTTERNDVMGEGSIVSARDREPWVKAAKAFFPKCDFTAP